MGDAISLHLEMNDPRNMYYLQVTGAEGPHGIGQYSVTVAFDDVVTVDTKTVEQFAGRDFRFLTHGQIRDMFEQATDVYFNDDSHADDILREAAELDTTLGFADDTHYKTIGSIVDAADVDHYRFKSAVPLPGQNNVMTAVVTSLESRGLIPQVELFTENGQPVPAEVLANGNGQVVIQTEDAPADEDLVLRIRAANLGDGDSTGNYRLTIFFGGQAARLGEFARGSLTAEAPEMLHALHVGQSQLMHLLLATSAAPDAGAVWLSVYDEQGSLRYRVASVAGDTRSAGAILLDPGSYVVQVNALGIDSGPLGDIQYQLLGASVTGPLGPVIRDPTSQPVFACPGQPGTFCYPGGVRSSDPFLWNGFLQSQPAGGPPTEPAALFDNWWNWFWSLQPGDSNGDQQVDINDLNNVRNHFGAVGPSPLGDTDGDGDVDLDDLNAVRNNFGAVSRGGSPAAMNLSGTKNVLHADLRSAVRRAALTASRDHADDQQQAADAVIFEFVVTGTDVVRSILLTASQHRFPAM